MIIDTCTITGLDDAVFDFQRITELSRLYPFLEWALLHSFSQSGKPRFPSQEWITQFHQACPDIRKSIHLCHESLLAFMNGDPAVMEIIQSYSRVQLNIGFGVDTKKINALALAAQIVAHPSKIFVLQHNDRTQHVLELMKDIKNVAVLFDSSAGTGQSPFTWPSPLPGRLCGYAGGIGPDNVEQVLGTLANACKAGTITWIDMESRIRTNDRLDFDKVQSVAETVALWRQRPRFFLTPSKTLDA